jgi:hypothetical protein
MERDAKLIVEQFMRSSTIPLLYATNTATASEASGTLFKISHRYFVVTVRHVFDDINPERLAYPEHRFRGDLHTIGTAVIYKPANPDIDVAVIELKDPTTISHLKSGWEFLTLDNVSIPSSDGLFVLVGYPSALSPQQGDWVAAKGVALYTNRLIEPPADAEKPINPEVDLFFEHGRTALQGDKEVESPRLNGASGASIWECVDSPGGFWVPGKTVRVVGVQRSSRHGSYFRGVSWGQVAAVLRNVDQELAAAVEPLLAAARP